jgi:UPF0716 family protein affecting phage T7 exclusion
MKYFLLYVFLEVIVSVNIASSLGALLTFVEIVLSAFIGVSILLNFRSTLAENLSAVSYKQIDLVQFQKLNLFTLIGAILLLIPGFLTDIIGIIMQFSVFTSMLVNRYGVKSNENKMYEENHHIKKDSDVIDVEIISDNSTIK